MRIPLLCLTLLFILSCKTREKPVANSNPDPEVPFGYSIDTLKSLNEYIPLLSYRKLHVEHYCYTIISHVNVVDVKSGTVLSDYTVVLHDNTILSILPKGLQPSKIDSQYRVLQIDGTGKYLAPGLCDMHVHYVCSDALRLQFLVNGVTTVRNANGKQLHLDEEQLLATQQLLGPNCYSTFTADNSPWLTDSSYHLRNVLPTWLYVNSGFEAATLQSTFAMAEKNELRTSIDGWQPLPEIKYPDNTAFEQWTSLDMLQHRTNFRTFWFFSKFFTDSLRANSSSSSSRLAMDVLKSTPSQFCIGTETQSLTAWKTCPVVNEMRFLAAHAVPNVTVLQIATYNAGVFANAGIPMTNNITSPIWFGEIKEGYRADLVLLKTNPLTDVANYANPESVFVNGVCLNAGDLVEMNKAITKLK